MRIHRFRNALPAGSAITLGLTATAAAKPAHFDRAAWSATPVVITHGALWCYSCSQKQESTTGGRHECGQQEH